MLIASHPFDDPEGDVVLRTTDGVHFILHKFLLSLASPFFKDMFSHADGENPAQETHDDRPCVSVQDESKGLYQLLSWCDPRGQPSNSVDDFGATLTLADKYGMIGVIKRVEKALESSDAFVKEDSVRVYAIARRFQFDNVAKIAARASLSLTLENLPALAEVDQITGTAVYSLYNYHFQCGRAAQKVVSLADWAKRSDGDPFKKSIVREDLENPGLKYPCCQVHAERNKHVLGKKPTWIGPLEWRVWWQEFMVGLGDKLFHQPVGSVILDPLPKDTALRKMSSCERCTHLTVNFFGLLSSLPQEIENAVDKVPLKLG